MATENTYKTGKRPDKQSMPIVPLRIDTIYIRRGTNYDELHKNNSIKYHFFSLFLFICFV